MPVAQPPNYIIQEQLELEQLRREMEDAKLKQL